MDRMLSGLPAARLTSQGLPEMPRMEITVSNLAMQNGEVGIHFPLGKIGDSLCGAANHE
jgi:hypothetical protein